MLFVRTSAVTVLHRGAYSKPDDADPVVWGKSMGNAEGQPIEKLLVMDAEGGIWDNLTLDPVVGPLGQGDVVELDLEIRREQKAAHSQGGRSYVTTKDKFRVVGAVNVSSSALAAA